MLRSWTNGLPRSKQWECYLVPSDGTNSPFRRADGGLRPDLVAGLTAAAVVLPKAMAYATVAGLPVSVGLYTAFVPMIVYALLDHAERDRGLMATGVVTVALDLQWQDLAEKVMNATGFSSPCRSR